MTTYIIRKGLFKKELTADTVQKIGTSTLFVNRIGEKNETIAVVPDTYLITKK